MPCPCKAPPPVDLVRSLLRYEPTTGIFYWRVSPTRSVLVGSVAGRNSNTGYRQIGIGGKLYQAHRLAWLYVHGELPDAQIDHKNLDRRDNRIDNLRIATPSEQARNQRLRADSTSGFKGVTWDKANRRWLAQIKGDKKRYSLGLFATAEEAHAAYMAKAIELFGEFARAA